jgi:acyl-CoA hydrolase
MNNKEIECSNNNSRDKNVKESDVETRILVMPSDVNPFGTVFGGVILSWIDMVASMVAQKHCGCEVVTASIDSVSFHVPVYLGEHIILKSRINYVGNTSMEIGVQVTKENPMTCEKTKTTSAYLTFVALDLNKKPKKVPKLLLETDEERRRFENARLRVRSRKELRNKLIRKEE